MEKVGRTRVIALHPSVGWFWHSQRIYSLKSYPRCARCLSAILRVARGRILARATISRSGHLAPVTKHWFSAKSHGDPRGIPCLRHSRCAPRKRCSAILRRAGEIIIAYDAEIPLRSTKPVFSRALPRARGFLPAALVFSLRSTREVVSLRSTRQVFSRALRRARGVFACGAGILASLDERGILASLAERGILASLGVS